MANSIDRSTGRIVVVGASLAGISAVRTLRTQDFAGEITLISDDCDSVYDRPPLSKQFLSGERTLEDISLATDAELAGLRVHRVLGEQATGLDVWARRVVLRSGDEYRYDGLVLATGAAPRVMWGLDRDALPSRVHVLRTATQALAVAAQLRAEGHRLIVIGAGFLGSEIASTASKIGSQVTVLEADHVPMRRLFGEALGGWFGTLQTIAGIDLRTDVRVDDVRQDVDKVAVTLRDGTVLTADSVVVAIGVEPNVDWLSGSGLTVDDGVRCDAQLFAADDVVAAGDVASWWNERLGRHIRLEHWTNAVEQADVAARNLLIGREDAARYDTAGYVWSDQFDLRIEVVGIPGPGSQVRPLWGQIGDKSFMVGLYGGNGALDAIVAVNAAPKLLPIRKALNNGAAWGQGLLSLLSAPSNSAK